MSNLKQQVRERFESIGLDVDQMRALQARIDANESPQTGHRPATFRSSGRAAMAFVVLATTLSVGGYLYDRHQTTRLIRNIAAEVAANHVKLKPLEVEASELDVVLGYFDRLDFQLVASPRIAGGAGDRLLGGRYCTIQGIDAAQLRVASADGVLSTWYEATLPPGQLDRIPSLEQGDTVAVVDIKGLQVRLWREHGIVFAEAKAPPGL